MFSMGISIYCMCHEVVEFLGNSGYFLFSPKWAEFLCVWSAVGLHPRLLKCCPCQGKKIVTYFHTKHYNPVV